MRKTAYLKIGPPHKEEIHFQRNNHTDLFSPSIQYWVTTHHLPHPHPPSTLQWLALACTMKGNPLSEYLQHKENNKPRRLTCLGSESRFFTTPEHLCLRGASLQHNPKITLMMLRPPQNPFLHNLWFWIKTSKFCFLQSKVGSSFRKFTRHQDGWGNT